MIKSLEGMRGIAAIFVALYHLGVLWHFPPIEYGYLFVDLFFVLSGFVITAAYSTRINTLGDIKSFLIRRFGRLFPLMLFSTVLFVICYDLAIWTKRGAVELGYANILKNPDSLTFMIPSFAEAFGTAVFAQGMGFFDSLILNYASWSISVEFYTYLLFAGLWAFLIGRARWMASVVLCVAGIAITAWASLNLHGCILRNNCYSITYDFGFSRCVGSFFLGVLSYQISRFSKINSNIFQLVAFSSAVAFFSLVGKNPMLAFSFPFICAALVVSICRDTGFVAELLQRKPFQILGQRSYSIYMLHPIAVLIFGPLGNLINHMASPIKAALATALIIPVYLGTIVAVAGWSYRTIESPFRERFGRISDASNERQGVAQ